MTSSASENGFTLIETLVAITLFSVVSISFYSVMLSGSRGADTTRSVVRVAEEARFGLNRMVRDTREAQVMAEADEDSYRVQIDFDEDGTIQTFPATNSNGDFEDLEYVYDPGADEVTLNGELLIKGIEEVPGEDLFTYSSNYLEYDWDADGTATWEELDAGPQHGVQVGNDNGVLDLAELSYISSVNFAMRVTDEDQATIFSSEAQLRNRRWRE